MRRSTVYIAVLSAPLALATLLPVTSREASACLWDDDTLLAESKGLPPVAQIVTGQFERNPARYYEMRIERVARALEADPTDLGAYDNAGVAADRLGRGDDAVRWMERKLAQIEAVGPETASVAEHRYRYHANLGTFLVHRWLRSGGDRAQLADLRAGRDHIALAIELNPDAHFGRERYQLMAMEWLLAGRSFADAGGKALPEFVPLEKASRHNLQPGGLEKAGFADAVQGLTGLIALGNAWESVDVMHTLASSLEVDGRHVLARMVRNRVRELVDAGKRSLVPGAPQGAELAKVTAGGYSLLMERNAQAVDAYFRAARAEADTWAAARTAYMTERLGRGLHPDTHPDFWSEFDGGTPPALPGHNAQDPTRGDGAWGDPANGDAPVEKKSKTPKSQSDDDGSD